MPQQTAPPLPRTVYVPGTGPVTVQPGQTIQEAIAAAGGASEPNLLGLRPQADPNAQDPFPTDPREFVKGMGKVFLEGATLVGGMIGNKGMNMLPKLALRSTATAATGAGAAALDGEDPLSRAGYEAGLTLAGEGAGYAIPRLGLDAALSIGGGITRMSWEELKRARRAFLSQADRMRGEGGRAIPVGSPNRVKNQIDATSATLESLENASPARIPPSQLRNLTDSLRRTDVGYPGTLERDITMDEVRFLNEQRRMHGPGPYTVRELGNIRRDLAHSPAAENVIKARINKVPITAQEQFQGQLDVTRANQIRDIQNAVEPRLVPVNEELSDLFTMRDANAKLRSGGWTLGDLGLLSMRGAIGYQVGKMLGLDPVTSSLGGWFLLSPQNLSRMGFIGGTAAEVAPHSLRTGQLILETQEERNKRVKRRDPK